jgi:hypothetical protein
VLVGRFRFGRCQMDAVFQDLHINGICRRSGDPNSTISLWLSSPAYAIASGATFMRYSGILAALLLEEIIIALRSVNASAYVGAIPSAIYSEN